MTNSAFKHSGIPEPGQTIAGKYVVDGFCGRDGGDIMSLPPLAPESFDGRLSCPELEDEAIPRGKSASARIVFGSVLILGGAAAAAFLGMYSCVHGSGGTEVARMGVAEHQPTATTAANTRVTAPPIPAVSQAPSSPPAVVAPLPGAAALGMAKIAAPSIPVQVARTAVPVSARAPASQLRTAQPAKTTALPLSKVRAYTVEPEPVPAPTARHLEEPIPPATLSPPSPDTTPTSTPTPTLPPATDDLFDSRN